MSSSASSRVVGRSVSSLPRLASLLPFLGVRFKPPVSLSTYVCVCRGMRSRRERERELTSLHLRQTSSPPPHMNRSASPSLPLSTTSHKEREDRRETPSQIQHRFLSSRHVWLCCTELCPLPPPLPFPFRPREGHAVLSVSLRRICDMGYVKCVDFFACSNAFSPLPPALFRRYTVHVRF